MTDSEQQPWGRVDETGTVFVRTSDGEREVGQYPDATAEEALAYFERKYADLAGQVGLLEQRVRRGAPAADVAKAVTSLRESVAGAHAVGDLDALARRLEALSGTTKELTEPPLAGRWPMTVRIRLVLPAQLRPTRLTMLPVSSSSEKPRSACTEEMVTWTEEIFSIISIRP